MLLSKSPAGDDAFFMKSHPTRLAGNFSLRAKRGTIFIRDKYVAAADIGCMPKISRSGRHIWRRGGRSDGNLVSKLRDACGFQVGVNNMSRAVEREREIEREREGERDFSSFRLRG